MQDGQPRELRMYLKHGDGQRLPMTVHVIAIRDVDGSIIGAAESFEAQGLAPTVGSLPALLSEHLDELTQLPSSRFVLSYLQARTTPSAKGFRPFTLLRLMVSHYPELLRRYGATACAGLLRNVAFSLRNALKPSDVLARWGESQFVVALEIQEEYLLSKVRERLQSVVDCTRLDWWGDSIALKDRN
jgi:GGDEF domain-containing protein